MNQLPSKDSEHAIRTIYWKVMSRAVRGAEEIVQDGLLIQEGLSPQRKSELFFSRARRTMCCSASPASPLFLSTPQTTYTAELEPQLLGS